METPTFSLRPVQTLGQCCQRSPPPLRPTIRGACATATTLTIPFGHALVVRQGGTGALGKATHRQRQSVMVTVWAPTQVVRTALAAAIDNLIKQSIRVAMPDTSQAIVTYSRTNVSDERRARDGLSPRPHLRRLVRDGRRVPRLRRDVDHCVDRRLQQYIRHPGHHLRGPAVNYHLVCVHPFAKYTKGQGFADQRSRQATCG